MVFKRWERLMQLVAESRGWSKGQPTKHANYVSTQVTFEDGRKGVISARVKIRDMDTEPVAAATGKAA